MYCTAEALGMQFESVLVLDENDLYPIEMWIEESGVVGIQHNVEKARN